MSKNKIIEFFSWLINSINPFPRMTKLMRMLDDTDIKTMSLGIWIWMTLMLYSALTLWTSSIILGIYIH